MRIFRKSVLIIIATYVIFAILSSFVFTKQIIDNSAEIYNECSIYKNSGCDFLIPSPSENQINEVKGFDFVESITPYYFTESAVTVNDKTLTSNILMLDEAENISNTVYNSDRLIAGEKLKSHGAIIDYSYAKKNNISVGDNVVLYFANNKCEYTVNGIFEANSFYDNGVLLVNWSSTEKEAVKNNVNSKLIYSGAWLQSANHDLCKAYLQSDYKPMGRLKDRSEFDSDEAYQIHVNAFNNASFASEIIDFSDNLLKVENKYSANNKQSWVLLTIALSLTFLVVLGINIFVIYSKQRINASKKIIRSDYNKWSKIRLNNVFLSILGYIISIAFNSLFYFIYKSIVIQYIAISMMTTMTVVYFVGMIGLSVVCGCISCVFFNYKLKNVKSSKS